MDVNLRPARRADVAALSQLGTESFVAKFGHLYRPADLAAYLAQAHSEEAVAHELANRARRCCLAEVEGRLAGYCRLTLACGWPQHARGDHVIELKQLYTDPALTGHGIGARLMEWALAEARMHGADEIQLSVWSGNHGAQAFYARYGFAQVAEVTFNVGQQVDEEYLFARLL